MEMKKYLAGTFSVLLLSSVAVDASDFTKKSSDFVRENKNAVICACVGAGSTIVAGLGTWYLTSRSANNDNIVRKSDLKDLNALKEKDKAKANAEALEAKQKEIKEENDADKRKVLEKQAQVLELKLATNLIEIELAKLEEPKKGEEPKGEEPKK